MQDELLMQFAPCACTGSCLQGAGVSALPRLTWRNLRHRPCGAVKAKKAQDALACACRVRGRPKSSKSKFFCGTFDSPVLRLDIVHALAFEAAALLLHIHKGCCYRWKSRREGLKHVHSRTLAWNE